MATMSRQAARTKVRKYLERKLVLLGHGDSLPPTRELMAESGVSKKRLEGVLSELESERSPFLRI